jgi:hypothetical protein
MSLLACSVLYVLQMVLPILRHGLLIGLGDGKLLHRATMMQLLLL